MVPVRMTGFNLPPGCEVHHIPGNRPEDELAEAVAEGWRFRCVHCGGFLRMALEAAERDGVALEYRTCTKCGRETTFGAWDTAPDAYETENPR